jgi:hypothetical protein
VLNTGPSYVLLSIVVNHHLGSIKNQVGRREKERNLSWAKLGRGFGRAAPT